MTGGPKESSLPPVCVWVSHRVIPSHVGWEVAGARGVMLPTRNGVWGWGVMPGPVGSVGLSVSRITASAKAAWARSAFVMGSGQALRGQDKRYGVRTSVVSAAAHQTRVRGWQWVNSRRSSLVAPGRVSAHTWDTTSLWHRASLLRPLMVTGQKTLSVPMRGNLLVGTVSPVPSVTLMASSRDSVALLGSTWPGKSTYSEPCGGEGRRLRW